MPCERRMRVLLHPCMVAVCLVAGTASAGCNADRSDRAPNKVSSSSGDAQSGGVSAPASVASGPTATTSSNAGSVANGSHIGAAGATGTSGGRPTEAVGQAGAVESLAGSGGIVAVAGTGGAAGLVAGASAAAAGGGAATVTCPMPVLKAGDTTKMISVGSMMRSYILHVPSGYSGDHSVPLIVDFHPLGGSGEQERQGSPYPSVVDAEGVVMAFPSGMSGPSGGAWNVGPCCVANVDDVAFARALVTDVSKQACIDSKRIYAVGFSMGGGMSHYLACHAADIFAAVAPAAFDLLEENIGDCMPARPISVIAFRGDADPIVPYAGGPSSVVQGMPVTFLGAMKTFEKWADLNHCSDTATAPDANNCQMHSSCSGGIELMLCTKKGGGHEPGNANVAWPFLKRHTLP